VNGAIESKPYAPLRLSVPDERLAACRLDPLAELPPWATAAPFYSVTRTPGELSVVCPEELGPDGVTREGGWRAFELEGAFDFGQVGVLVSVTAPLSQAGVSISAVSTFDTDYVLVQEPQLDAAVAALRDHGHEVRGDRPASDGAAVATRPATGEDEAFLWEMLAEAAQEDSVRAVAENPGTAKYVEGWGRDGDSGVVAVAAGGEPLGAAWLRLLRGEDAGYGYVDDKIPELAIAVRPGARGAGIGARLTSHLLQAAKSRYRVVSLGVRSDNPALNLYGRMGFRLVEGSQRTNRAGGTPITMKLDLHE
jgi:ribosomal protein S18 acetylase RimI-like enzyme